MAFFAVQTKEEARKKVFGSAMEFANAYVLYL